MNIMKGNGAGFSLIEMLITMIISGILFIAVSMIVIYANQSWLKASSVSSVIQDSRSGKKTIEFQIRGAIPVPPTFAGSGSEPFTISPGELFQITPSTANGRSIVFNVIDRNKNTYKLDKFSYDNVGNTVKYDYWYASTAGPVTTYTTTNSTTVVIISNVQNMKITAIDVSSLQINITQSKKLTEGSSQVMISTTTFLIKARSK